MLTSELTAALQKVQQIAGDIPVTLVRVEDEAETVLKSIGIHIDPSSGAVEGGLVLEHGAVSPSNPPTGVAESTPPPAS